MALVCLDPGHAKSTAGKRSFDEKLREYEFNRAVAKKIKAHLERHSVDVMYACDIHADADTGNTKRATTANSAKADIFVSIHANAYGSEWNNANGWEVFYCEGSAKGKLLAEAIRDYSIPALGLRARHDNGLVATTSFTVVTKTTMPAVLIEHGFYTNKEECAKLLDEGFRNRCAEADAKGILKYLGIAWIEPADNKPISVYDEQLKYLVDTGALKNDIMWSDSKANVTCEHLVAALYALMKK